jgi:hypothetical protein
MANIEVKDLTSYSTVQKEELLSDSSSFIEELSESDQVVGGFFLQLLVGIAAAFIAKELLGVSVKVTANVPLGGGDGGGQRGSGVNTQLV